MDLSGVYHRDIPEHLRRAMQMPELRRLGQVGMNCGCEYTDFPLFRDMGSYSRLEHSIGVGLIVWHFTESVPQSLAALFHDIATPAFAHVVDFLRGDYLTQEATEEGTEDILRRSAALAPLLAEYGVCLEEIRDYHQYPLADNDTPRLSADRLEYTLGNLVNFGFGTEADARLLYEDLVVAEAEDGTPELAFASEAVAAAFGAYALRCSRVYVSDADRCTMQYLAELLGKAVEWGVLGTEELQGTEPTVIERLLADERTAGLWSSFRRLSRTVAEGEGELLGWRRVIPAKKRCIDPLVAGKGRLSALSRSFREDLNAFRERSLLYTVSAE